MKALAYLYLLQNMRKAYSHETAKGVAKPSFDKGIRTGVNHEFNQPSPKKLGIEMRLYQQKLLLHQE